MFVNRTCGVLKLVVLNFKYLLANCNQGMVLEKEK